MSEETTAPTESAAPTSNQIDSVILRSYPKIVFLWPSFIVALVAGIFMLVAGEGSECRAPPWSPGRS